MDFPITDLMDEDACYAQLVEWLHPNGFVCPRCHECDRMVVHRRRRPPYWTTVAATANGCSTPSRTQLSTASSGGPPNWS
jgi:Transposase zinc-ribbon domain